MSRPIPAADYVEHFDPELPHHRAWLLAVLEQLVAHEPQALEEGGTLRRLWTERQEPVAAASPSPSPSPPAVASGKGNPLSVPWFAQLDSATDQVRRMCFSSSCAMLLAFLKPGVLTGSNGDDQVLARVRHLGVVDGEQRTSGDTTDAAAQIRALASYGIKARFTSEASFATLEEQIAAGVPVPCGYLHRGHVSSPAGGGHWLIVVGITPSHVIVHDPLGEADLVNGTTIGGTARFCRYSRQNYRCAGLRLRAALDTGGRGQQLGSVGGGLIDCLVDVRSKGQSKVGRPCGACSSGACTGPLRHEGVRFVASPATRSGSGVQCSSCSGRWSLPLCPQASCSFVVTFLAHGARGRGAWAGEALSPPFSVQPPGRDLWLSITLCV